MDFELLYTLGAHRIYRDGETLCVTLGDLETGEILGVCEADCLPALILTLGA